MVSHYDLGIQNLKESKTLEEFVGIGDLGGIWRH